MHLKEGSFLKGGEFRIEKKMGQGGFGITYLGVQVGLNRKVAIKEFFMKEYCNRDEDTSRVTVPSVGSQVQVERFREKFVKEAQTIASLENNHIIRIYDVFQENGTAYYVMEYHDHGSLSELVKHRGKLAEADAVSYIRQMAGALQYIHGRKIAHLDIKPGNVLLDSNGHAVLIDFGMSKHYDEEGEQTSTHPAGVSHGYAPLEQYKKGGVATFSPASDIYSLGATLYKLVTGVTPPDATEVEPEELSASLSGVSVQTRKAILQAMQLKSKDRPQSVDEFLSLLDASEAEVVVDDERTDLDVALPAPKPLPQPRRWFVPVLVCLIAVLGIFGLMQIPGFGGDDDESLSPDTLVHLDTVAVSLPVANESMSNHRKTKSDGIAEVSNPVVETASTTTSLYVSTSPSGATVYIDGKKIGKSPIEGNEIARGKHTVKIEQDGYETFTKKYTFDDEPIIINEVLAALATEPVSTSKKEDVPQIDSDAVEVPVTTDVVTSNPAMQQKETPTPKPLEMTHMGMINGHEYVDLGLSVKWATQNIGASRSSDYGDYFAWGEVTPKKKYTDENCSTYNKPMSDISGDSFYDAASYNWGGSWRLPTYKEMQELVDKCKWTWTNIAGHKGYMVKGPNGLNIFLPAGGFRIGRTRAAKGIGVFYQTSTSNDTDARMSWFLVYLKQQQESLSLGAMNRSYGACIRPVSD